jgi:hypothetical protein
MPLGTLRFCFFAPVFLVGRAMSLYETRVGLTEQMITS